MDLEQSHGSRQFNLYSNDKCDIRVSVGPGTASRIAGASHAQVKLTLSGRVTASAQLFSQFLLQPGLNGQISFRRLTPYLGEDDLLTAAFTNADVNGRVSTNGGNFNASNTGAGTLDFFSDFLTFSAVSANDFSVGLSSLNPALAIMGGQLRSFTAAGAGTFSAEPGPRGPLTPIPEPVSVSMLGGGLLALGTLRLFRRA
jgi:hypothetical protein